ADRRARRARGARSHFADQVPRGGRSAARARPGGAGARRAWHDRLHSARVLVPSRTGRADLRRSRRSAQVCGRAAHPQGIRPEEIVSETRAVRAGEEFDLGALNAWIAANVAEVGVVAGGEQFPGGFSNLTYLLKDDRAEFGLRRPPAGVGKGPA